MAQDVVDAELEDGGDAARVELLEEPSMHWERACIGIEHALGTSMHWDQGQGRGTIRGHQHAIYTCSRSPESRSET